MPRSSTIAEHPRTPALLWLAATAPVLLWGSIRLLGMTRLLRLGVAGAVVCAAAALAFTRPRWGVLFVVSFMYSSIGVLLPVPVTAPVVAILVVASLLVMLRGESFRLDDAVFWWSVALFSLFAIQSMLFAYEPSLSAARFFILVKSVVFAYLVVQFIDDERHLRMLGWTVFIAAACTVPIGFLAMELGIRQDINILASRVIRFAGAFPNPNRAASYMCAALPLGIWAIRHGRARWTRMLSIVGVVLLIVGMFSTFSRSVFFPFALVVAAASVREVRNRWVVVLTALLVATAILLTPRYYWDRLQTVSQVLSGETRDWSIVVRMQALRTAWHLFLEHPWTGIGLNNFIVRGASDVVIRIVVHNSYMEILVGTGIPGLVALLAVYYSGFRHMVRGVRARWRDADEAMRGLSFYFALSLVSALASAFFGNLAFIHVIWVPLAAGLVIGRLIREHKAA